jgi:cell division protein YceG involved in septum cleavage
MDNDTFHIAKNTNKQKKVKKILSSIGKKFKTFFPIIVIILLIIYFLFSAPRLNKDVTIHISPGENIKSISIKLKERKAIKNDFFLRLFIIALQSKKV